LVENYFAAVYDFVFSELLTGEINIQRLEDILNPEYCKEQSYYMAVLSSVDFNPIKFVPFNIHWDLRVCLRIVDGKILDNIWLVNSSDTGQIRVADMEVTVEKNLDLDYKTKCFHNW
jgi:hypothetical protein